MAILTEILLIEILLCTHALRLKFVHKTIKANFDVNQFFIVNVTLAYLNEFRYNRYIYFSFSLHLLYWYEVAILTASTGKCYVSDC